MFQNSSSVDIYPATAETVKGVSERAGEGNIPDISFSLSWFLSSDSHFFAFFPYLAAVQLQSNVRRRGLPHGPAWPVPTFIPSGSTHIIIAQAGDAKRHMHYACK